MNVYGCRSELDPPNPSPDMLLDTKKSLFLIYGHIDWAPLCSFSKHFLSDYYGHIIISNKDVTPSNGAYSMAYSLPPSLL